MIDADTRALAVRVLNACRARNRRHDDKGGGYDSQTEPREPTDKKRRRF